MEIIIALILFGFFCYKLHQASTTPPPKKWSESEPLMMPRDKRLQWEIEHCERELKYIEEHGIACHYRDHINEDFTLEDLKKSLLEEIEDLKEAQNAP